MAALEKQAAEYYSQRAFTQAAAAWQQLLAAEAPSPGSPRQRELVYRVNDAMWRSRSASAGSPGGELAPYLQALRDLRRQDSADRWAALASESLGDHDLAIAPQPDVDGALSFYGDALETWAALDAGDETRQQFLRVLLKPYAVDPERLLPVWSLSPSLLDKALSLSLTPSEGAQVRLLLALSLMHKAEPAVPATWARITENLSSLLATRVEGPWLDDALMLAARWTEQFGTLEPDPESPGAFVPAPDLPGALPYFRRVADSYTRDSSKFHDAARAAIGEITTQTLTVTSTRQVLPEMRVPYTIAVANVGEIEVSISKFDLAKGFQPDGTLDSRNAPRLWTDEGMGPLVRSWKLSPGKGRKYYRETLELSTEPLPPGAYWLQVVSGNFHDATLLIVSRGVVQFVETDGKVTAWVLDSATGLPFPSARVTLYCIKSTMGTQARKARMEKITPQTTLSNLDGLAVFTPEWPASPALPAGSRQPFQALADSGTQESTAYAVVAMLGDSPAVACSLYSRAPGAGPGGRGKSTSAASASSTAATAPGELRICAMTDSPAYRPTDTLNFRVVCREFSASHGLRTPAGLSVDVSILDPNSVAVLKKSYSLNEFGSLADSLPLSEDMARGQYVIKVSRSEGAGAIDEAQSGNLFAMEDVRSPEYKLEILPPQRDDGTLAPAAPGSRLHPRVRVSYANGGPVAEARVDYRARLEGLSVDNPFADPAAKAWFTASESRSGVPGEGDSSRIEIPVLAAESGGRDAWAGLYDVLAMGSATTDTRGELVLDIPVPESVVLAGLNLSASVMDPSRRQLQGTVLIPVTRRPFLMTAQARSRIVSQGETVDVDVAAMEVSGVEGRHAPTAASAVAIVTRDRFVRRVQYNRRTGAERLLFQGYEAVEVLRQPVSVPASGRTTLSFAAPGDGYYRVYLVSDRIAREFPSPTAAAPGAPAAAPATTAGTGNGGARRPGSASAVPAASPGGGDATSAPAGTSGRGEAAGPRRNLAQLRASEYYARATFFSATARTRDTGYRAAPLEIHKDKTVYKPGDTARLLIIPASETGGIVWLSVRGRTQIYSQVLRIEGAARRIDIPVTEDWQPNVRFMARYLSGRLMETRAATALVPFDDRDLQVTVTHEQPAPRPGEKARVSLDVRDSRGRPARAEVSVGVVDTSVFEVALPQPPPGTAFLDPNLFSGRDSVAEIIPQQQDTGEEASFPPADTEEIVRTDLPGGNATVEVDSPATAYDSESAAPATVLRGRSLRAPAPPPSITPDQEPRRAPSPGSTPAPAVPIPGGERPTISVRNRYKISPFWNPAVITDERGLGTVEFTWPENLADWQVTASAVTSGQEYGEGQSRVRTSLPATIRLKMPRFVVEGDKLSIFTIVHNLTKAAASFTVDIITSPELSRLSQPGTALSLEANSFATSGMPFEVRARGGKATVTATLLRSDGEGDSARQELPIVEYGTDREVATSFAVEAGTRERKGERWVDIHLNMPDIRDRSGLMLDIQLTPSLASTVLDALPYLAHFPYSCTEQTLDRFLPAAVAAQTLRELKLEPSAIAGRISGRDKDITQFPGGLRLRRGNTNTLDDMVRRGNEQLAESQNPNGGWGWWKGSPSSDFVTAHVLQGLAAATRASLTVDAEVSARAANYLKSRLAMYENNPEMLAWMLYALAVSDTSWTQMCDSAGDKAWAERDKLSSCGRALLALTFYHRQLEQQQYSEYAIHLVRSLEAGAHAERSTAVAAPGGPGGSRVAANVQLPPDMCYWGRDMHTTPAPGGAPSATTAPLWADGPVEATSYVLRAMLAVDPQNPRIDMAARWLTNHRTGPRWTNTRDTSAAVMALLDYLRAREPATTDFTAELLINGQPIQQLSCTSDQVLGSLTVTVPESQLKPGNNPIQIRMSGRGTLYTSARLRYTSRERPIAATISPAPPYGVHSASPVGSATTSSTPSPGTGTTPANPVGTAATAPGAQLPVLSIRREYYRERAVPLLLRGSRVEREPLKEGEQLAPGENLLVRLLIENRSPLEYLMIEDRKPAGCEPFGIPAGGYIDARTQNAAGAFPAPSALDLNSRATQVRTELRPQWIALFLATLPAGRHEITYHLRAETPGEFHALPATAQCMYLPAIRATSAEHLVRVGDAKR
ncbi:hypothetical protein DB346_23580 [Verrucomicrobia bacterium LW23]|nr:hypothetical protein DB346_23580 [Verrucomicrobia bacterium LW23]